MKIYLLEGRYTKYICLADDLLEVQSQLVIRYKWAKDLSIKLDFDSQKKIYFILSWKKYNMNSYQYDNHEAKFDVLLAEELIPDEKGLISTCKDCYK